MAMKVLNWFHRKLQVNEQHYCPISPKKDHEVLEEIVIRDSLVERDTEALLLQNIFLNGILTIGTLGHDQSFLPQENLLLEGKKETILHVKNELETNKQVLDQSSEVVNKPLSRVQSVKIKSKSVKGCEFNEMVDLVVEKLEFEEERVSTQEKPLLMIEEKREIKMRTTLAELFAADMLVEKKHEIGESKKVLEVNFCEHEKMEKKKKEEKLSSTNTRKLNRLMRKIMRKKIYPEHLNGPRGKQGPLISS